MASDYTWVYNDTYNETVRKDREQDRKRKDADREVGSARFDLRNADKALEREKVRNARELEERLEREQAILTAGLESVSEEVRGEITRQNERLRQCMATVQREMNNVDGRISELDEHITGITEAFDEKIQSIFARIDDKKDRAAAYRNQLQLLVLDIRELHPEKLTPGEADLLYEALDYVEEDIKNTDFEAAIGVAQIHILTAACLRERLEVLNEEYAGLMQQLFEHSGELEARFATLKEPDKNKCPLPQEDAREEEFDGKVYYWSGGILESLEEEFETVWSEVRTGYAIEMDLDMLRPALEQLQMMHSRIDSGVEFAHNEFYEYVRLCRLVLWIHRVMTEWGWNYDHDYGGFVEDDKRRAYTMAFTNGEGRMASIGLIPTRETGQKDRKGKPELGETKIGIAVFSPDGEKRAMSEIVENAILSRLAEAGIKVNLLREKAGTCANASEFVQRTVLSGDRAKDGRLSAARENIQVTR